MKKTFIMVLSITAIILIIFLLFANSEQSAKQIMIKGVKQGDGISSYSFNSAIDIYFDFSEADIENINSEISTFPIINLLDFSKAADERIPMLQKSPKYHFIITGQEDRLSKKLESGITTISYIGETQFPMDLSILQEANKLYIKIPEPALNLYPSLTKEYLYIETDYLMDDGMKQQVLGFLEKIDEDYFLKGDMERFQLKEGEIAEVVTLNISQDDINNFDKETLDQGRTFLISIIKGYSFAAEVDFPANNLIINNLSITNIYNQDGYQSKSLIDLSIDYRSEKYGLITINFNMEQELYDINQKIEFKSFPDSQNVINGYDELSDLLNNL